MSKKKEEHNKSQMRRLLDQQRGIETVTVTDEDVEIFFNALFGDYKGGYQQE